MTGMSASAAACSWVASAVPSIEAMIRSVGALGDHLVDLLLLGRDVVAGELQVDLVAGLLQALLDGVAVGDPALGGLRRHRDADREVAGSAAAPDESSVLPAPLPEQAASPSATTAPIAAMVIRRIAVLLLIVERSGSRT